MSDDDTDKPPAKKTTTTRRKPTTPTPLKVVPETPAETTLGAIFDAEQLRRVEALKEARQILRSGPGSVDSVDVIDLAEYITTGLHPFAKYDTTNGSDEDSPRLSFTGPTTPLEGTHP